MTFAVAKTEVRTSAVPISMWAFSMSFHFLTCKGKSLTLQLVLMAIEYAYVKQLAEYLYSEDAQQNIFYFSLLTVLSL